MVTQSGECVCELGVYGIFVGSGQSASLNEPAGHLLRKKLLGTDEGGVAAGYMHTRTQMRTHTRTRTRTYTYTQTQLPSMR